MASKKTPSKKAVDPSKLEVFQYSFLALPLAFAGLPLYVHAPDFYTRELGVNIGMIGIVLLVIRMFDAIQDPFIGYISDQRADKRFLIVALGAIMLFFGIGGVFYGPPDGVSALLWFAATMVLATTGFSIITINLNMIGGMWHDSPGQRTRISAWREAFALTGLLIASVLPAALQISRPAEASFKILFWVFGIIMVAGFIMFTRFMARISPGHLNERSDARIRISFLKIALGPDRMFFLICFLTHIAAAIPGVMVLFFINDYLQADNMAGLFLFLYFMSGAAFMPLWVKLADKIGKDKTWLISMVLAISAFIWAYTLGTGDIVAYGIICVLSGTALGADLALPPSILADRITRQKSQAEATQYYAILAFIPKMAIALASGISFLILDQLGFVPGQVNDAAVMGGLITIYALAPCIIKAGAAGLLWVYHEKKPVHA